MLSNNLHIPMEEPLLYSLNKTKNFHNNQKYIYGNIEESALVSVFVSQRIIQNIVSYLGFMNGMPYFIFGALLLAFSIFALQASHTFGETLFASCFLIPTVYFIYKGLMSSKQTKINSVHDYFFMKQNVLNNVLWFTFMLVVGVLICVKIYLAFIDNMESSYIFLVVIFILVVFHFLIFLPFLVKEKGIGIDSFLENLINFKLNFINIVLFPLVSILIPPIFIISYFVTHFTKYQTYKLKPHGNMLGNFEKIGTLSWKNDFYEITKR